MADSARARTINHAQQLPIKTTRQETGAGLHRWTCICIHRHTFVHSSGDALVHKSRMRLIWSAAEPPLKTLTFN